MKRIMKALAWLLCAMVFAGAVACSGQKSASGKKSPDTGTLQQKSVVTDCPGREKAGSSLDCAPDKVVVENNALSLPGGMMNSVQASSSLGLFMAQNGASAADIARAQSDLAKGLGTGAPQPASELVKSWALLMSTAATMGTGTVAGGGAMLTGGAIGGAANVSTQLTVNGDKPFSYTDALIAIGTGALTQGKGPLLTGGVSVGGSYIGSTIKGEDPTNAMIGAGVGSAIGSGAGKITENVSSEIGGAVVGSITSEVVGGKVTDQLDTRKKTNENK